MTIGEVTVAEDVYWLLNHDVTGKPRTSPYATGVMISAGVLAELFAVDHVCIVHAKLTAHVPVTATDSLHREVLAQIIAEDDRHSLHQWLEYLSENMRDRVADRMVSAGRARRSRNPLHRSWAIANEGDQSVAWIHAGLVQGIRHGRALDANQQFLLSLAQHSGMSDHPLSLVDDDRCIRFALHQLSAMRATWVQLAEAAADLVRAAAITR